MRKYLSLLAIAAAVLSSCTAEEEFNSATTPDKNIGFNTSVQASRAVTTINNLTDFSIDAFLTQDGKTVKYISGETATKKDGVWGTTTEYIWPHSGNMQFFAANPTSLKINYPADFTQTAPNFTYSANSNAEQEQDVIYAVTNKTCESAYGKSSNASIVDINFRHALAQVIFKAKNTNPKWELDIENVKIQNIYSTGTYSLPLATTAANADVRGSWAIERANHNYVTHFNPVLNIGAEPVVLTSADNGAFLLLPQKHTAWDRDHDRTCEDRGSYFLISCKIRQVLDDGTKVLLWPSSEKDAYAEVAIPVEINWEEGKQYIYTFVFGNSAGFLPPGQTGGGDEVVPGDPTLSKIGFNVTVSDFVTPGNNTDINM